MDYSLLLLYAISIFLLIITPGPVVALIVSKSINEGPVRAFKTALGTNWASLLLIVIASLTILGVINVGTSILNGLSIVGCLFIIQMAFRQLLDALKMGFSTSTSEFEAQETPADKGKKRSDILTGFLVGISNPKDIIFFVAFFPQFLKVTHSEIVSLSVLSLIWIVIDLSILSSYIFLLRMLKDVGRYSRAVELFSSLILMAVAVVGITISFRDLMLPPY